MGSLRFHNRKCIYAKFLVTFAECLEVLRLKIIDIGRSSSDVALVFFGGGEGFV